jgi:anti-sigma regulatory factor (Ser/Thr protein kinase)
MRLLLSVDLPAGLALLSKLRRTIRDALELCEVGAEDIDELELMIGELSANAACHSCAGEFSVEVDLTGRKATITVTDNGEGFVRAAVAPQGTDRKDGDGDVRVGGWGLPLVENFADQVVFLPTLPHGTTVRAVKSLRH